MFLSNPGSIYLHNSGVQLFHVVGHCSMQDCGRELLPVKILNRTDTFTAVFVKLAILRKGRSANVAVNLLLKLVDFQFLMGPTAHL